MHSHTLCRDGVMLRPDGMPYGIQSSRRLIGHHSDVCNFVRQCSGNYHLSCVWFTTSPAAMYPHERLNGLTSAQSATWGLPLI